MVHQKPVLSAAFVHCARHNAKGFSALMTALFAGEVPAKLVAAVAPHLLWGAEDRTANRKVAEKLAVETSAPAPIMLTGAGHMPQLETPAAFVRALEALLRASP